MNYILEMGTSIRHNQLISRLQFEIMKLFQGKDILTLHEQIPLCYLGSVAEPYLTRLIDLKSDNITKEMLNSLQVVQPDYMLFETNKYISNPNETRLAGQPDLIVEIWSDYNIESHRNFKKFLYSTSDTTEHWYIEQNENNIECWLGNKKLPEQSLKNILSTQSGIKIDLRHLAI